MKDRNPITETCAQATRKNRRERNLRHQHHRAAPGVERSAHRANINFSLAAAGHAVEQQGRKVMLLKRLFDLAKCVRLRVRKLKLFDRRQLRRGQWVPTNFLLKFFDGAFLDEIMDYRLADASRFD